METMIRNQVIKVTLISLKARKKAAEQFILNRSLQFECTLLEAQIKALKNELKRSKA